MEPLLDTLATYVAGLRYDDIPEGALHGLKARLVDSVGCAYGGHGSEPVTVARRMAAQAKGEPSASVWLSGERTTPDIAAFTNELLVRYLDFNDTYFSREGGHPSDTIAGVLSLADAHGLSGRDALAAMTGAYEVFCGLGEVHKPSDRGIDHSLHVAIGTAAGAAKVLGLDARATGHAIAIAVTANPALRIARAGTLSMWKAGSPAQAARNGVFAAQLAAAGMTGPDEPFTGEGGLAEVTGQVPEMPKMGGGDAPFHTDRTSIKAFPAQYNAQAAIWAALDLRAQLAAGATPDRIVVTTYGHAVRSSGQGEEKWRVRDRETADHSIPYLVAVALLDGEVTPRQFTDARIADPAVQRLIARVEVREDAAMSVAFPGAQQARIDAEVDGRTLTCAVENAKGHAASPLSDAELEAKFRSLAEEVIAPEAATGVLTRLWAFERESSVRAWAESLTLA